MTKNNVFNIDFEQAFAQWEQTIMSSKSVINPKANMNQLFKIGNKDIRSRFGISLMFLLLKKNIGKCFCLSYWLEFVLLVVLEIRSDC